MRISAMSMRDSSLNSIPPPAGRPLIGLHDYGRLEIAAFEQLDMLSPMRPRIARLLAEACLVPGNEVPADTVTLGSIVRYRVDGDRLERRLLTLGREYAPNDQYVNVLTPVGLALIGRRPGETATAETFEGRMLAISIAALEYQPEAAARAREAGPDGDGPEAA
jgi:regulator of nucleoside diphosphate kinase